MEGETARASEGVEGVVWGSRDWRREEDGVGERAREDATESLGEEMVDILSVVLFLQ